MSDSEHILDIRVYEGRNLPRELLQTKLQVTGIFNGQKRTSQPSTDAPGAKEFNSILRWRLSPEDFRVLNQTGLHTCKLLVHRDTDSPTSTQEAMGWVAIDLKQAKVNAQQFGPMPPPEVEGEWYPVRGMGRRPEPPPELKILPLFYDKMAAARASAMRRDLLQVLQQEAQAQPGPRGPPSSAPALPGASSLDGTSFLSAAAGGASVGLGGAALPSFIDLNPSSTSEADTTASSAVPDILPGGPAAHGGGAGGPGPSVVRRLVGQQVWAAGVGQGGADARESSSLVVQGSNTDRSSTGTPEGSRPSAAHSPSGGDSAPEGRRPSPPSPRPAGPEYPSPIIPSASAALPNPNPMRRSLTDLVRSLDPQGISQPRRFRLTIDVRSFKSGRRLPLNLASVFAAVQLPPEVTPLLAGAPLGTAPYSLPPLRTHPPVDIVRGCEGQLPNACTALEFTCEPLDLARTLVSSSSMLAEVWHRERHRSDLLLGVATLPLNPLLQDPWVDGWAPLYALMLAEGEADVERKVQVGSLRVVVALEDLGVPPGSASASPAPSSKTGTATGTGSNPSNQGAKAGPQVRKLSPVERERATQYFRAAGDAAAAAASAAAAGGPAAQAQGGREVVLDRALALGLPPGAPTEGQAQAASLRPAQADPQAFAFQQPPLSPPRAAGPYAQPPLNPTPATRAPQTPQQPQQYSPAQPQPQPLPYAGPPPPQPPFPGAPQYPVGGQAAAIAPLFLAPSRKDVEAAVKEEVDRIRKGVEAEAREEMAEWRRREEAAFRARVREIETERLSLLEGEWRKRERAREAEVSSVRTEYGALEAKLREVLAAAEEREARVLAAEEALGRRRKGMEHEHGLRVQEAEAAVRRLQAEFEHQLVLERERTAEAVRQRQEAEKRYQEGTLRYEALHQAFEAHRDRQRNAPEGRAQADLALAVEARMRAEERAERLGRAKKQYKEQVLRLAREVANLQRQRLAEAEQWMARERRQVDALTFIHAVGAQTQPQPGGAGAELQGLRQRLVEISAAGQALTSSGEAQGLHGAAALRGLGAGLPGPTGPKAAAASGEDAAVRDDLTAELRRLLQERAELLDTGVYGEGDPIIAELTAQTEAVRAALQGMPPLPA